MPQPFEQFPLQDSQNWPLQKFREECKKVNTNEKIGDLAHFLIHNFKDEISSKEHVIDIAIRILSKQIHKK